MYKNFKKYYLKLLKKNESQEVFMSYGDCGDYVTLDVINLKKYSIQNGNELFMKGECVVKVEYKESIFYLQDEQPNLIADSFSTAPKILNFYFEIN